MSVLTYSVRSGLLYVSLVVLGPLAFLILPEQYAAEYNNGLLVTWIFVELLIIGVEIVLSYYLFKLFNEYDHKLSKYAFILRLLVVLIMIINALFLVILLIGNVNESQYVDLHSNVLYIWQLFFSVHVGLLGYMLYKNNPTIWKYLGIVLVLGGVGYAFDSIISLGQIDVTVLNVISVFLLVFVTLGEIGLAIGLLMKKVIEKA